MMILISFTAAAAEMFSVRRRDSLQSLLYIKESAFSDLFATTSKSFLPNLGLLKSRSEMNTREIDTPYFNRQSQWTVPKGNESERERERKFKAF
jgi:hypothetical protein